MRNAGDAFICGVFRYPADELTVVPGAGIAEKFLRQKYRQKVSLEGGGPKIRHSTNHYFSEACAFRR
jgi:hypothetical protein